MKYEVGFVYVISNEAMPGMVKFGVTQTSPAQRAKELVSTGVPAQFDVDYFCVVYNPYDLETTVHNALGEHRARGEWFAISPLEAIAAIQATGIRLLDQCWNEKFNNEAATDQPSTLEGLEQRKLSFFARQTSTARTFLSNDAIRDVLSSVAQVAGRSFADVLIERMKKLNRKRP